MAYLYCPHCEFTKEVSEKFLGVKGKCPSCGEQAEAVASIPEINKKDEFNDIDNLDVSDSWKQTFKIFEKIGAEGQSIYQSMNSPALKVLSFKEKLKINFNLWAFFFGPFYYIVKKMWLKGAVIFGGITLFNILLTLIEVIFDTSIPQQFYWLPGSILCAQMVNYDYHRFKVHHETMWKPLSIFSKPIPAVSFPVVAMVFLVTISIVAPPSSSLVEQQMLTDVSGVWSDNTDGNLIVIDLSGKKKTLTIANQKIPVTVDDIDTDDYIIDLKVRYKSGKTAIWKFQQHYQETGRFTLSMKANGVQGGLSFVRNI